MHAPFHEFAIVCLIVDEIAGYEICNAGVFEALLNHFNGSLAGFAFDIQVFDLLESFIGLFDLLLILYKALGGSVDADDAIHALWMQACQGHSSLRSNVMAQKRNLFHPFLISIAQNILSHLFVCHASMVI